MDDASTLQQLISDEAWNEALALAVDWWRRTRAPELAALVDWLGERAETPSLSAHGADPESFHTVWRHRLATLGAPALRELLPTLLTKLPDGPRAYGLEADETSRSWQAALFERLEALAAAPADPRIAQRLASFVAGMQLDHSMAHGAYRIALAALGKIADPRTLPVLRDAAAGAGITREHLRSLFAAEIPACLADIERTVHASKPLDEATRAGLSVLLPRTGASSLSPDVLFAQVLAEPARIELRHVWADALLERGDVRGEFVALQLKALSEPPTAKEDARRRALQHKHQRAWLGPLAAVFRPTSVRFEAGCLVEARLAEGHAANAEQWRRCSGEPALATLKCLRRGTNADAYLVFLTSPFMTSLEWVEVNNNPLLERITESRAAAKVRHVTLERTLNAETFDLLERLPRLEAIHLGAHVRGGAHREELDRRKLQRVRLLDD